MARRRDPLQWRVAGIALVAVAARLYDLGARVFAFDEAWVAYEAVLAAEAGTWEYRPVLHGPFLFRVVPPVVDVLGPSDFAARLVVALLGGLVPLAALLFRERLDRLEVTVLAVVLAVNPIALYYSRYLRNDVPLAVFALFTLGLLVRLADTGRPRYLYAAAVTGALAFTTKESAVVYLVTWVGAGLLLLGHRLVLVREYAGPDYPAYLLTSLGRLRARSRPWWRQGAVALGLFLGVLVGFYAPRSADPPAPGLYNALARPGLAVPVVREATLGTVEKVADFWVYGPVQSHPYPPYLADTLHTLAAGAPGVVVLGVVGFVHDRYAGSRPRDVVAFGFYTGAVSVFTYPFVNHFPVPWSTVHAVVPLAIPAAVGVAAVSRWGRTAANRGALTPAVVAVLVVGGFGVHAVGTAVETAYLAPQDSPRGHHHGSELVYYNQPPPGLDRGLPVVREAVDRSTGVDCSAGVDVLYYGEQFVPGTDGTADRQTIAPGRYNRLPLPWYTLAFDADVESTTDRSRLRQDPPPVVITSRYYNRTVRRALPGYGSATYRLDDAGARQVVVFVDGEVLREIDDDGNRTDGHNRDRVEGGGGGCG